MRRIDREITDTAAKAAILQDADTCHLALIDGDKPYIVALNYGAVWKDNGSRLEIYFHCAKQGRKLDIIRHRDKAAFFIDTGHELVRGESDCNWGMKYRSVAGEGTVSIVRDDAEKKAGLDSIMAHYSGRKEFSYSEKVFDHTEVLKLTVTVLTGKQKS
jgi:uncharacterized protein